MQLIHSLEEFTKGNPRIILTIGTFDGVHRGHQAVFRRVKELAGTEGQAVVLTFSNHPAQVLRPEQPAIPQLCTIEHKTRLIAEQGIDTLIMLPFTKALSKQSAEAFLDEVRRYIPFTRLVLGHDATIGRNRQGNPALMHKLAMEGGFDVEYIEEYRFEGSPVSSRRIRQFIQEGNLNEAERGLGRPYSIFGMSIKENDHHCIDAKELCLPPAGKYAVTVQQPDGHSLACTTTLSSSNLELPLSTPVDMKLEIIFLDSGISSSNE